MDYRIHEIQKKLQRNEEKLMSVSIENKSYSGNGSDIQNQYSFSLLINYTVYIPSITMIISYPVCNVIIVSNVI